MKKLFALSTFILFFGLVPHVFAQGFVPLAVIPGLTNLQPTAGGLATFFNNLYRYCIGFAAALAVIEIIWGGLEYSTQDSVSKKSDGKDRIYKALYGLVLVLSPWLVFSIINPSILNLSLNLPPLGLSSATVQTTSSSPTSYQAADLQQIGNQIQQDSNQNPSAQIRIPIVSGSDQELQNISAQCKANSNGTKSFAVKGTGTDAGYYICI